MKKLSLILVVVLLLTSLTACGNNKDDEGPNWNDDSSYADIIDEDVYAGKDRNLEGGLYDESNKPEGSEAVAIYSTDETDFDVKVYTTYILPENMNIDYILKTISAFSTQKTMNLSGYVIDDIATVNIDAVYAFQAWLTKAYPNDVQKYTNKTDDEEFVTDVRGIQSDAFAMLGMEAIDRTLKESLGVKTVVFKTNNDEEFVKLSNNCPIVDGVFFTEDSSPKYIASEYNYYDGKVITEYIKEISPDNLATQPVEEQIRLFNENYLNQEAPIQGEEQPENQPQEVGSEIGPEALPETQPEAPAEENP